VCVILECFVNLLNDSYYELLTWFMICDMLILPNHLLRSKKKCYDAEVELQ